MIHKCGMQRLFSFVSVASLILIISCGGSKKKRNNSDNSFDCAGTCQKANPNKCDISSCEESCESASKNVPAACKSLLNMYKECVSGEEGFACSADGVPDVNACYSEQKKYEDCIQENATGEDSEDSDNDEVCGICAIRFCERQFEECMNDTNCNDCIVREECNPPYSEAWVGIVNCLGQNCVDECLRR